MKCYRSDESVKTSLHSDPCEALPWFESCFSTHESTKCDLWIVNKLKITLPLWNTWINSAHQVFDTIYISMLICVYSLYYKSHLYIETDVYHNSIV